MWKAVEAFLQFLVGRDVILHTSFLIGRIRGHIKISGAGQTKQDRFAFAAFFTFKRFINGRADSVS